MKIALVVKDRAQFVASNGTHIWLWDQPATIEDLFEALHEATEDD